MRIYSTRHYPDDGVLRRCTQVDPLGKNPDRGNNRDARSCLSATVLVYANSEDKVNLAALSVISRYVFCTPRCYISKSWEVGVCNTYQVRLLVGGENLSSRDFHVLMLLERIHVFLQYLEIQEQTTGYFYLPDRLNVNYQRPRARFVLYPPCRSIISLSDRIHDYLYGGHMTSVTGMITDLCLLRYAYFNELHISPASNPSLRQFHRVLGSIYGKIHHRFIINGLKLRQYFAHQPLSTEVRIL